MLRCNGHAIRTCSQGAAKPPADCHTITVPNFGYQKQLFLIVRAFAYGFAHEDS
jgi:hypothetical protein